MQISSIIRNKGLKLSILTVLVPLLLQLFYVRYVSYNIDESIFGNFIIFTSFVTLVTTVIFAIPIAALTRYINHAKNQKKFIDEFLTILLPLNLIGISILYIFHIYKGIDIVIFLYMSMYLVFLNRYSINKTIIFQLLRRKQYFYISIVEKISRFILPIVVFHFYGTDYGLMFGLVLGYFLLNVYTSLGGGWFKHKFVFSYRRVRVYFLYAYPVIFTALASWIISLSDRFFIDHFLDTERVGIYSILSQVGGLGSILGSIFIVYVQPIIYKEYSKDKKNALFMYLKYMKIVALIFIIIFLLFLLIPKYFFTLLINPEIIADGDYYVILSILFLSSIFGAFITCSSHFFHLKNKIYVLTLFWCVAAIINLFGNLFIQKYGLFAAGLSTLSSNLVIVLLICVWIYRNIIKTQKNYAFGKF